MDDRTIFGNVFQVRVASASQKRAFITCLARAAWEFSPRAGRSDSDLTFLRAFALASRSVRRRSGYIVLKGEVEGRQCDVEIGCFVRPNPADASMDLIVVIFRCTGEPADVFARARAMWVTASYEDASEPHGCRGPKCSDSGSWTINLGRRLLDAVGLA